jgi:hypothetical protein
LPRKIWQPCYHLEESIKAPEKKHSDHKKKKVEKTRRRKNAFLSANQSVKMILFRVGLGGLPATSVNPDPT